MAGALSGFRIIDITQVISGPLATRILADQGADVILQHTDSPAPLQIAEKRGMWAVGQASDMTNFGKKAHLTSIIDDWDGYYVARTKAVLDGTWAVSYSHLTLPTNREV